MTEAEWLASDDPQAMLEFISNDGAGPGQGDNRIPLSDRKLRLFACAVNRLLPGHRHDFIAAVEDYADNPAAKTALFRRARDCGYWCATDEAQDAALTLCETTAGADRGAALLRDIVGNPFKAVTLPNAPGCPVCGGTGRFRVGSGEDAEVMRCRCCPWITPTVLSLATAAYDERQVEKRCPRCEDGMIGPVNDREPCPICPDAHPGFLQRGGTLDSARLAVLSDALEEAGCMGVECPACGPAHIGGRQPTLPDYWCGQCDAQTRLVPNPILAHLRSPGPHVRGCWALDLILNKE